jgi:type VI secretion system secreted protein Hcp
MAVDVFLKIAGVEGESDDHAHKGEIEIESWNWGEAQSGSSAFGKGSGSGRVDFRDFRFVKRVDKSSPKLFQATCNGQHFENATLSVRKAGTIPQDYMKAYFHDVIVSSFQMAGVGATDEVPREQITFNFGKVEIEYRIQDPATGQMKGPIKAGYDIKTNTKT